IQRKDLNDEQANEVYVMMSSVNDIESIGDIIDKNVIPLIQKKHNLKTDFSDAGKDEIIKYHTKASKQISRLEEAYKELNTTEAAKILKKEEKYTKLESEYRTSHLQRISNELPKSIATHPIHMELMDLMKQINVYTSNIAKTIITSAKVDDENKK
ncbi:MAG: hypothetical protein U9P73_06310, partial [Candidatus Cloacimonadota bacterium]|nr:hypothetical protein [Candidatus Cloacimonadota bacterium]